MLNNMYFSFRDQVSCQREGLLMGSNISGILVILFIDILQTIALSLHLMISPSKRYVDNIYLQTTNEETAEHFHHIIMHLIWNLKLKTKKQHQVACHYHYSISESPYPRMATALWILQRTRQKTTISLPSVSYSYQIQTQLHLWQTKMHRGQMLLTYLQHNT